MTPPEVPGPEGGGQSLAAHSAIRPIDGELAKVIVGATTDTILILDVMGRIKFVTSSYEEVLGRPYDYWLGRSAFDLIFPDDLPQVLTRFNAALEGSTRPGDYVQVRLGAGMEPWLVAEVHGFTPISFEGGPAVLVSVRDYTGDLGAERGYAAARRTMAAAPDSNVSFDNRKMLVEQYLPRMFRGMSVDLRFMIVCITATNYHVVVQTSGRKAASLAMHEVGLQLLAASRHGDLAVRCTDSGFLIACGDVRTVHEAKELAERFQSALGRPKALLELTTGYAVGSIGDDFDELIAHAGATATPFLAKG